MSKHNFVFPLEEWEGMPNPFKVEDPIPDEYDSDESIRIYVDRIEELKRFYDETDSRSDALEYLHELDLLTWEKEWNKLGFESLTKQQWELCTGRKHQ